MPSKTKIKIIEGTAQLLIEKGFSFLTVDSISQHLGISKKTLYNHFENKYAIYNEAFMWDTQYLEVRFSTLFQDSSSTTTRISNIIDSAYHEIEKRSKILSEVSLGKIPASILDKYRSSLNSIVHSIVKRIIDEASASQLLRKDIDLEILRHVFIMMIQGNLFYNQGSPTLSKMDLFLNSIQILRDGSAIK